MDEGLHEFDRHKNGHREASAELEAAMAMDENMNGLQAFARLGEYLEANNWQPQRLPDKYVYRTVFRGTNGTFVCYAQIRTDAEQFVFYVLAPVKVPESHHTLVSEYLTRANYGMYIGNFEMDLSDGEVRYKSSFDFEDVELSDELIRNALWPAVRMMDKYLPGMFKCMYSGVSPADAIAEIEG